MQVSLISGSENATSYTLKARVQHEELLLLGDLSAARCCATVGQILIRDWSKVVRSGIAKLEGALVGTRQDSGFRF